MAPIVLLAAAAAVLGLLLGRQEPKPAAARGGMPTPVVLTATVLALLTGPGTWSVATAAQAHRGANVASGPPQTPGDLVAVGTENRPAGVFPSAVVDQIQAGAAGYDWPAAVIGHRAADLQLSSRVPVWAVGGFSGRDPHPTLPQFLAAVAGHRVHYLLFTAADAFGSSQAGRIVRWAEQCRRVRRIGSWLLADVGSPAAISGVCSSVAV